MIKVGDWVTYMGMSKMRVTALGTPQDSRITVDNHGNSQRWEPACLKITSPCSASWPCTVKLNGGRGCRDWWLEQGGLNFTRDTDLIRRWLRYDWVSTDVLAVQLRAWAKHMDPQESAKEKEPTPLTDRELVDLLLERQGFTPADVTSLSIDHDYVLTVHHLTKPIEAKQTKTTIPLIDGMVPGGLVGDKCIVSVPRDCGCPACRKAPVTCGLTLVPRES